MKKAKRKNSRANLTVLNEKGELIEVTKLPGSNSIQQERLRQSRLKFNLASILIATSAAFCFTGIVLFWSGEISEEAIITTVDLASRIVTSCCLPLIERSQDQLNELAEEDGKE